MAASCCGSEEAGRSAGERLLRQAREFARAAHAGQTYNGAPYIRHPERVAATVSRRSDDPLAPVVAWLHDVVEDTRATLSDIGELFGEEVAADLEGLTRREGEEYRDYLRRVRKRPRARLVKLADLEDNLAQFAHPNCRKPPALKEKYRAALACLQGG